MSEKTKEIKGYSITVRYNQPNVASMVVPGANEEEARARAMRVFAHEDDAEIVDLFDVDECPRVKKFLEESANMRLSQENLARMLEQMDEALDADDAAAAAEENKEDTVH